MTPLRKAGGKRAPEIIGWRELVALPDFGISMMKAKIDTGARTSALHAVDHELFDRDGQRWVRFLIPIPGRSRKSWGEAPVLDDRFIKNTSGVPERRLIIHTTLLLGQHRWHIECSLANREKMEFDLILGRTAIRRRRLLVDPGHSFILGPHRAIDHGPRKLKASKIRQPAPSEAKP